MTESRHANGWDLIIALKDGLTMPAKIGGIVLLILLISNTLFPKAFWQSLLLEWHRAQWQRQGITHYRMSVSIAGLDYGDRTPLVVEVKDNNVISVMDAAGRSVSPEDELRVRFPYVLTIPGLFSRAKDSIREKPTLMIVDYDQSLSYPDTIVIDWNEGPQNFPVAFRVFYLQILPP